MHVIESGSTDGRRSWSLVLETGEEAMSVLEEFARTHHVRGAHVRALGAFRRATLAYFDWERKEYDEIPVDEQVEVAALVGDVGRTEEGEPAVHVHCVLGRPDGSSLAGHLVEGVVRPTLELFVVDEGVDLVRRRDPESGLTLIRP